MEKNRGILFSLIWLGLFYGVQLAVRFIMLFIKLLPEFIDGKVTSVDYVQTRLTVLGQDSSFTLMILMINAIICLIIFGLWFYRMPELKEQTVQYNKVYTIKNVLLIIVTALGIQVFVSMIIAIINHCAPSVMSNYLKMFSQVTNAGPIYIIYIVVLGPIMEEILFRGLMFNRLSKGFGVACALILQSIAFGIYHSNLVQGIYTGVLGILFAFVYIRFKTIFAPILLHCLLNASSYLVDYLLPISTGLAVCIIMFVISGIILAECLYVINKSQGGKLNDQSN